MKNYCKTIGALAAASALVAGTASAEIEYNIGTGYTNEYLFRGLNLGQDLAGLIEKLTGQLHGLVRLLFHLQGKGGRIAQYVVAWQSHPLYFRPIVITSL
jgi:hypothetical protein